MQSAIKIKTAPTAEPVTKQELKDNLRLDNTEQDSLLDILISSARQAIEAKIHRTLINTVYVQYYDKFPVLIELYRPPVSAVASVKYYDSDGNLQTVSASDYNVDYNSLPPRIVLAENATWPTVQTNKPSAVEIEYTAGYGADETAPPEALKQAVIMLASDIYEHPEANVELKLEENRALKSLLAAYNVPYLGGNWE
jgi:uncharacterized phiE125 gp8 family phage protein